MSKGKHRSDLELVAFAQRPPSVREVQKLRLILSTYQDGTGQLVVRDGSTLPGWRDFERSVALAFGGQSKESKYIFDVLIPDPHRPGMTYGLSCKMRRTLNDTLRTGRATIELSNSARLFWNALANANLNQKNYRRKPQTVGQILVETVEQWHQAVSLNSGGNVDLTKSFYLSLSWNHQGWYQLHQFPLQLPVPEELKWSFPSQKRITGYDGENKILEWYGESGGQLKYYPSVDTAIWTSEQFQLENISPGKYNFGVLARAAAYFPELWTQIVA
jgi:hypothetical protein